MVLNEKILQYDYIAFMKKQMTLDGCFHIKKRIKG